MRARWVTYPLTPNSKCACPTRILYYDTETNFKEGINDQTHSFRLAVTAFQLYKRGIPQGKPQWRQFKSSDKVWNYISSLSYKGSCLWVVAHNLDFDFSAIEGFSHLDKEKWSVKFWAISSSNFLLRIKKKSRTIQWLDSMGFISASIKKLGEKVELPKLPMPKPTASDEAWFTYCHRDVEIMKAGVEAFISFVRENDLGKFSFTLPGQALQAFRHRFLTDPIWLHRYPDIMEKERESYHGGRTEAFYIGTLNQPKLYYLDVTSMYPSVMLGHPYPIHYLGYADNPTDSDMRSVTRRFEVMVEGDWSLTKPVLPYVADRLIFPIGNFSSVITGPEYKYLLDHGWVKRVTKVWVYQRGYPFDSYINYFWKVRKTAIADGDIVWDWISKLFMNSLYGKFAQRNPIYEVKKADRGQPTGITAVVSSVTGRTESRLVLGGKIWLKTGEEPAHWTFYPLSSWVTAYARLKLWTLIDLAGRGHVYYCDTDSVFVDQIGYNRLKHLLDTGSLGALGIKRIGTTLKIHGAKDYEFDGVRYIKGVPTKATEIKPGVYSYLSFEKTRTRMRHDDANAVIQRQVTKKLSRKYVKGEVTLSGEVIPYELS